MVDTVTFQDGDDLSELNLALALGIDNLTDYVERGYGLSVDYNNNEVDVGTSTANGNLLIIQDSDNKGWFVLADKRTNLTLPETSGTNYIYVSIDPSGDDDIDVEVNSTDAANRSPALKIGEVDTSNNSKDEGFNREPSQTFGSATLTGDLDDDQSNTVYDYSAQQIAAGVVNEEKVQDTVDALLTASGNISLTYDDGNDTLTVDTSALNTEETEDAVASLVASSSNLSWNYDDGNDTLTISLSGPITGKQIGTSSNRNKGFFSTVNTDEIRLATGQAIEDGSGTERLRVNAGETALLADDGTNLISLQSGTKTQIAGNSSTPIILRDNEGSFDGVKYITSSSTPGTLKLTNAKLVFSDNNYDIRWPIADGSEQPRIATTGNNGEVYAVDDSGNQTILT